jgi:zinc transport system substrate-binding protein
VAGCGGDLTASDDGRISVATGFYPLAWLAGRIAGPDAGVDNLTKPGAEPHDLELTPRQVIDITRADLVVYIRGIQPALDKAVGQHAKDRALDAAEVVHRLPGTPGTGDPHGAEPSHAPHDDGAQSDADDHGSGADDHGSGADDHGGGADGGSPSAAPSDADPGHAEEAPEHGPGEEGAEHGHEPSGQDPHIWLDPARFAAVATALRDRLSAIDPAHAAAYRARAQAMIGELDALDREFRQGLARCERKTIVTGHESFGYLADRYRLEQVGITGLDPHVEPSPKRLAELARLIRETGVTTVFLETNASAKVARVLASETGVTTAALDPIEGVPPGSAKDYPSLMRQNLGALRTGLGCR